MKKLRKSLYLFTIIFLIITVQQNGLFSDFIFDDLVQPTEERGERGAALQEEKYPPYIARNIRAEAIPDIKGAVRITWRLHRDSKDDYIVGRSSEAVNTAEKALKAVSIKVVPAGVAPEVIDFDLKSGAYYYCVLSRSRIMDREIELYADENYNAAPVIIDNEVVARPESIYPRQVSLIHARVMNRNQVRLTWRGIDSRGIVYTVYRNTSPLDSPEKFREAEVVQTITDGRESYVDTGIYKSGTYYYAVTTRDIAGNEDMNLVPDQSYTLSGVYVSLDVPLPVINISARPVEGGIRISWEKTSTDAAEYLIYSHTRAISGMERVKLSSFAGRVPGDITSFTDKVTIEGNYYYAVLTKLTDGRVLNELVKDQNYTTEPVVIGAPIRLLSFKAMAVGNDIDLTWKINGTLGEKNYVIFRKERKIMGAGDLENADIAGYININELKYTDRNLNPGKYYYAIAPESKDLMGFYPEYGVNVTSYGIEITEKARTEEFLPEEKAGPEKKAVPERRVITGKPGVPEKPEKPDKLVKREKLSDVDFILKNYFLTGRYSAGLRKLEHFVTNSNDEKEIAKARLFIGRTLIELKRYKDAVNYLVLKDVNQLYPEEAKFWREFALLKISNGRE